MRKMMIAAAALAAILAAPAVAPSPAEAAQFRFTVSAPQSSVTTVAGQVRSHRSTRHRDVRRLRSGRHGYAGHRALRGNGPQSFGYRNLSGRFTPRFNTTGRRINSLLRY